MVSLDVGVAVDVVVPDEVEGAEAVVSVLAVLDVVPDVPPELGAVAGDAVCVEVSVEVAAVEVVLVVGDAVAAEVVSVVVEGCVAAWVVDDEGVVLALVS